MTWFNGASVSVESDELVRLMDLRIVNFGTSGLFTIICGESFSQNNFLLFTKMQNNIERKI